MKRIGYLLLFALMFTIGVLIFVFGYYLEHLSSGLIFVEIAIYCTLIIFEIKELGPDKRQLSEYEKYNPYAKSKEAERKSNAVGNNDANAEQKDEQDVVEEKIL